MAHALLFQASLPIIFLGEEILIAAYVVNCTPSAILKGNSPYEILYSMPLSYNQLRVFVSACYRHRITQTKINTESEVNFVFLFDIHSVNG